MLKWLKRIWNVREVLSFAPALDGENVIVLGNFAADALKNPAIETALKKVEEGLVHAWETSRPKDGEAREHLYYTIQGLAMFKLKLQGMVSNMVYEAQKAKENSGQPEREPQKEQ